MAEPDAPPFVAHSVASDDIEATLTAEEMAEIDAHERKYHERLADLSEMEKNGWKSDGNGGLCHPDDPEVSVWFNPYTLDLYLSPKFIERLKAMLPLKQE
ncbi:hypothetical protein RAS1_13850 [Phycisphaerae bacterium RAS1]|nr:hypothetical protein RAS1_13850 [Phycisphaerae bacterium RAS1]